MAHEIWKNGRHYLLLGPGTDPGRLKRVRIHGYDDARHWLQWFFADVDGGHDLRSWMIAGLTDLAIVDRSEADMLDYTAWRLVTGELRVVEKPEPKRAKLEFPVGNRFEHTEEPVAAPQPPMRESPTHWIEIELVDAADHPVPDARYIIVLPDGEERWGKLDGNGLARITDIPQSGQCKVSFPDYDAKAWRSVGVVQ